jgi:hypothetical protein
MAGGAQFRTARRLRLVDDCRERALDSVRLNR